MKTAAALAGILLLPQFLATAAIPNFATADLVLGQSNFTSDAAPAPPSATSLKSPFGVAVDPVSGKVWVADSSNNRVLRYASAAALANGAGAEIVIGQATFADNAANQGGTANVNTLSNPTAVYLDSQGRLWIADAGNNRILRFNNSASLLSNAAANGVLGQPDFTTETADTTASKLSNPVRVWLDQNDRLWVADAGNNRVVRFNNAPIQTIGASAAGVLGQPDFTTSTSGTTATTMSQPGAVAVDAAGRLFVIEAGNNRVLRFDAAGTLADGAAASAVLGQPNFTLSTAGTSAAQFTTPIGGFVTSAGTLWVADAGNSRIVRYDNAAAKPNGAPADGVIGQPDFLTTTSGLSSQKLGLPTNVWVDGGGSLWVADSTPNNRVLRFLPEDSTPPTLVISGKKKITTTKAKIRIRGTAADSGGIREVRFRIGKGAFKKAKGTTTWSFKATLKPGRNKILVRATDDSGVTSKTSRLVVIRRTR